MRDIVDLDYSNYRRLRTQQLTGRTQKPAFHCTRGRPIMTGNKQYLGHRVDYPPWLRISSHAKADLFSRNTLIFHLHRIRVRRARVPKSGPSNRILASVIILAVLAGLTRRRLMSGEMSHFSYVDRGKHRKCRPSRTVPAVCFTI